MQKRHRFKDYCKIFDIFANACVNLVLANY